MKIRVAHKNVSHRIIQRSIIQSSNNKIFSKLKNLFKLLTSEDLISLLVQVSTLQLVLSSARHLNMHVMMNSSYNMSYLSIAGHQFQINNFKFEHNEMKEKTKK